MEVKTKSEKNNISQSNITTNVNFSSQINVADDDVNASASGKYPETDNEKNTFENPSFIAEAEEKVSGDQNPESEVKMKELATPPPCGGE